MRTGPSGRAAVLAGAAWAVLGPRAVDAQAVELNVDRNAANVVRFISRASIEEFEGTTDRIDGYVILNGARLGLDTGGDGTELYLEVDLASLDTGISLRNRHMRDNYLEVRDYPFATYEGTIARTEALSGGRFRVTSSGTMSIHGVERSMQIPCDVSAGEAVYEVSCFTEVLLTDFDIEIPRVMFLKLSNEIRLELQFSLVPAGSSEGGPA